MAANVPVTIWRPTNGEYEMGQSDSEYITTEADVELITENDVNLIVEDGTYTPKPATIWVENDGV